MAEHRGRFDGERHARRLAPAGAALAVGGGCVGGWLGGGLVLVGLGLLLAACVSAIDGPLVIGPFARAELLRGSRWRWRWWVRSGYAVAAAGAFVYAASAAYDARTGAMDTRRLSAAAGGFFAGFAVVQFCLLTYLTVQQVAPVVAEERETKRWEILLTTDLRAREILLGKAAGRLPRVLEPALATLPVLALLPLLGGVSPQLVAAAGLATVASVLGTAGLAFFYSVFAPTARKAVEWTYGFLASYLTLSGMLYIAIAFPVVWTFPSSLGYGTSPVEVADAVDLIGTGNPFALAARAGQDVRAGADTVESAITRAVGRYAAFQAGMLALFGLTAVSRLRGARPWAATAGATARTAAVVGGAEPGPKTDDRRKAKAAAGRPPVGDDPVYWWERFGPLTPAQLWVTRTVTWAATAKLAAGFAVALSLVWVMDAYWPWGRGHAPRIAEQTLRMLLVIPSFPLLIGPTFRATRSVAQERGADTLEAVRLTALTPRDILYQKWLAAAASEMPLYRLTLAAAAAGVATGLVPVLGLLAVAVFPLAGAGVGAAVGLAASAWCHTPGGAASRVIALGILGYPCCYISPPVGVGLGLWSDTARQVTAADVLKGALIVAATLVFYAAVGVVAFRLARRWFEADRQKG